MPFLSKIFGDANRRAVAKLQAAVAKINELEPRFERFSLGELKSKTGEFRGRLAEDEPPDSILPEAFAAVREAAKRTLGQRHFDVQLIGGMVLHQGKIAEMKTGEGKTLVATLAAYLNALTSKGVHIVTVNDYLSRRDTVWMGQIYDALGLTVGCLNHEASYLYDASHRQSQKSNIKNQNDNSKVKSGEDELDKERDTTGAFKVVHEFLRPVSRREAYQADITYGTNNEYGFDYLRDNMVYSGSQMNQRPEAGHNFAIVDEIDSILIDEARTPLIISAPDAESTHLYETFAKIVPRLKENEDYNVDEKLRAATVTEKGIEKVEKVLGLKNIYEEGGTRYVHHLEQALKAHVLFHRDKDYVVNPSADGGEVIIVDDFTGRLMPGRRWSGGLHQAIEAKEGVLVQKESRTLATITFQNYFRLYRKLAGMTGTAQTSAEEFHKVYRLEVVSVPTNQPMIRVNQPDRIYKSEKGKFLAVAEEIKERHKKGQPVLVGTVSIAKNETLSAYLDREGIPHKVLNAKNHEQEAEIIAQAGRAGAVTVATNMAGRGVDIMLGGYAPSKVKRQKAKGKSDEVDLLTEEEYKEWQEENERVKKLGGLHVIGTERHEARRIDNQLRGRSGRQGDPGSSQFFISAEDELLRIFGGDRLKNLMERLGVAEDEAIENRFVSGAIEQAQTKVEGNNFDIRKYVLEYDDVMNRHRSAIYELRREVLGSNDVSEKIIGYVNQEIERIVDFHTAAETSDWNVKEIIESVRAMSGLEAGFGPEVEKFAREQNQGMSPEQSREKIMDFIKTKVLSFYHDRSNLIVAEAGQALEKTLLLRVIDELWVDHLEQMEYLRDSVRLRAYGQRDPLVEYKIEGQRLFNELQSVIGSQVANLVFKVGLMHQPQGVANKTMESKPEIVKADRPTDAKAKVGRNDPCPCGATKPDGRPVKYKKCHGIS